MKQGRTLKLPIHVTRSTAANSAHTYIHNTYIKKMFLWKGIVVIAIIRINNMNKNLGFNDCQNYHNIINKNTESPQLHSVNFRCILCDKF